MHRLFVAFALYFLAEATACAGALQDANKAVARRVFADIFNGGRFEVASEIYAADFVNHGLHRDVGLAEDQAAARGWKAAFPDLVMHVDQIIAEGDRVCVLWTGRGTNTGTGNGLPATGRKGELRGMTLWRISGGRIREEWSEFDNTSILQQLGLAPEQ